MIKKSYGKGNKTCRVTFELPAEIDATTAFLAGDFNDWSPDANPLTRRKDGRFSVTVSLPAAATYRYRFLIDGERWENDWQAEGYAHNDFGSEDSLVTV